jgi:alginate O-acetyltransferase complex protein AlgI
MVFSSILFLFIYLPIVLAVYYLVPPKYRNLWLFVVNLVFYGWGEPVYIGLMLLSICINYVAGILVGKYRITMNKRAKLVLTINTVINLGILFFFKYFDLVAETLSRIPGVSIPTLGLALPIGISFYTFQTMSYPIDVYRGDGHVQKNFIKFGTFVALFPQLIAGPIVRYKDIAQQLDERHENLDQFTQGIQRFMVGLGKKVLIANNVGMLWDAYAGVGAEGLTFAGAWLGAIAFSLQIYFDFSGYSDMAIGLGKMLGFEFLENFNYPYISHSVTEFWHRWHISLGNWFADYLYYPLGGNRKGLPRQILNILIVWACTGIWHGASWTFLFWGLYYAFFLFLEKTFLLKALNKAPRFVGHLYTLLVAISGWVIFQQTSVSQTMVFFRAMYGFGQAGFASDVDLYYLKSYGLLLLAGIVASLPVGKALYGKLPQRARAVLSPVLILVVLVLSTAYLVDSTYNPFLYFRF